MTWDEVDDYIAAAGERRRKEIEAMPKPRRKVS